MPNQPKGIELRVLPEKGKAKGWGRRWKLRLTILVIVQVVMILHILIWWLGLPYGWETLSAVEPSESIQTVSDGIINAGAIFFAVALLSTAILGRWFCGWGCHLVLLQDWCLRLLSKVGVRPRAFRSRLLMLAPFLLAIYMFIWPIFYRLVVAPYTRPELTWNGFRVELLTRDLWATMPGVGVAVVFLFLCGFVTVYFLGAKGFCTYACPYGGFFMPLDKLALRRVHVDDNCQGCAYCTAVCTSNVRVHEQIVAYRKVIDAGCMRTSDCIEACPNDALSMQWGLPVLGAATHGDLDRPKKRWDLTWTGEITLAVIMFLSFLAWRGAYGLVPLLLSLGAASTVTWLCWKAWRIIVDANGSFHRWVLKKGGVLQGGGIVFLIAAAIGVLATVQAGATQLMAVQGNRMALGIRKRIEVPMQPGYSSLTSEERDRAEHAIRWYQWSGGMGSGGFAMATNPNTLLSMARIYAQLGQLAEASRLLEMVQTMSKPNEVVAIEQMMLQVSLSPPEQAPAIVEAVVQSEPQWARLRYAAVQLALRRGDLQAAGRIADGSAALQYQTLAMLQQGRVADAAPLLEQYVKEQPDDAMAWIMLAEVRLSQGDASGADAAAGAAVAARASLGVGAVEDFDTALQNYRAVRDRQDFP